ncbi:MAG: hypothetical protein N4A35_09215 [Flavobacteriales bacterium]|jgi:hypothetical protein|nr:hypothetical protein [Flavobacteriales bacterium]
MIKKIIAISLAVALGAYSCNKEKKLAKLEGNNKEYKEANFVLDENISLTIPNTIFSAGGFANCWTLLGLEIDHEAFIPTENPNPYAHLTRNLRPLAVEMELSQVELEECGFAFLKDVEVYLCLEGVTDFNAFTFRDATNPQADYNAVKIGEHYNIADNVGSKITLNVDTNAVLDKFIHAGNFQTYTKMVIDKGFTDDYAIIRTKMKIAAQLDNYE